MKILITGGSEGIGLETAKILAEAGHAITLVARTKEALEKAVSSLFGNGHQIVVADLTQPEDRDMLKEKIETNSYDALINNAGVGMYGRFTAMSLAEQLQMMELNITALTMLSYWYLSSAKKGDALVNVSSVVGTTSYPGAAVYAASKAYVTSLSESLWREYTKKGIYVVGFCPGVTYTNFHNVAGGAKDRFSKLLVQTPQQVACELVRALEQRNKPIVFSGRRNRVMIFMQRTLSRKLVLSIMFRFSSLKGK